MNKNVLKNLITILTVSFLLVGLSTNVYAHGDKDNSNTVKSHDVSVDFVIQELLQKENVSDIKSLDCGSIKDVDFEKLGDAIMEEQYQGKEHDVMDNMMGGNNSDFLFNMHVNIGRSYLGCGDVGLSVMENLNSKETSSDNGYSMMNFSGDMMGGLSFMSGITWFIIDLFLLSGVYFFIKQANKK